MNNCKSFIKHCEDAGIELTQSQREVAEKLFSMPEASGKSTLVALLWEYDESARKYAAIKISADGLEPEIEARMIKILECIPSRAGSDSP